MPNEHDQLDGEDQAESVDGTIVPAPNGNGDDETEGDGAMTPGGHPAFITELKSIEVQVGENIVQALRLEQAAAVLTFVQPSPAGGQRLVSIPVDLETLAQFQALIEEPPAKKEVPCIGFHCVLNDEKAQPFLRDDEGGTKADETKKKQKNTKPKKETS